MRILTSSLDASTNFIEPALGGLIEARYVRRQSDYFIVYLSSHTGCNKGCRMCHLTQTKQTQMRDASLDEIVEQAKTVLNWYDSQPPAQRVHFNFMARGEVFANGFVLEQGDELIERLERLAADRGLLSVFKFSTIMPRELENLELTDIFRRFQPDIYYSLYSLNPQFRRRWLPRALPAETALAKLWEWQQITKKIPVLHWAYIEGENDSIETAEAICRALNEIGLRVDINIVRYNPFSDRQGHEPPEPAIERNAAILADGLPGAKVQIVKRVGLDVKASCGMFVADDQN